VSVAAFMPTLEDSAWANVVVHDSKVLSSDMSLISSAATAYDLVATKKYCDFLVMDATATLENSQAYSVSSELQKSKDYYELAISSFKTGAEKVSDGCASMNVDLMTEGTQFLTKGSEYIDLATRELNIAIG